MLINCEVPVGEILVEFPFRKFMERTEDDFLLNIKFSVVGIFEHMFDFLKEFDGVDYSEQSFYRCVLQNADHSGILYSSEVKPTKSLISVEHFCTLTTFGAIVFSASVLDFARVTRGMKRKHYAPFFNSCFQCY